MGKIHTYSIDAFISHNGELVNQLPNKDDVFELHDKNYIQDQLYSLLQQKNTNAQTLIQLEELWEQEYSLKEIQESYAEQCGEYNVGKITNAKSELDIVFGLLAYQVSLPLRYIAYIFATTYYQHETISKETYQTYTKQELYTNLQKLEENRQANAFVNHEVFVIDMTIGRVFDIGS